MTTNIRAAKDCVADVAIIHSADKEKAAARLVESVAAAGFAVVSVEIGDPTGLADAVDGCAADARILIWSRPLVSHALHSGELARIRQIRGLIEVSADGITPPSGGDELRVVSISGWRGQPFHPGWQRIALELKRLCGSRKPAPEAAPPPAPAKEARPERVAPTASSGGARPQGRRLMLGAGAAALLAAAAAGAAIWFGESAPQSPPRQELRETPGPAAARPNARPDPPIEATMPDGDAGPPQVQPTPAPSSSQSPAAAEAKPDASAEKRTSRPAPPEPVLRSKPRTSQTEPAKKYSRKNSKVMRQFCERSGRSTPQCRTFLRSIRDSQAPD
ncbi:MAG TPA: hypothetical protein VF645_13915 [Allosphingosinicella sp.]|jgi:hypothetical protein